MASGLLLASTSAPRRRPRWAAAPGAVLALAAAALAAPSAARGDLTLLDRGLSLPASLPPRLAVFPNGSVLAVAEDRSAAAAGGEQPRGETQSPEAKDGDGKQPGGEETPPAQTPSEGAGPSLDFDLLGEAKPPPEPADAARLRRRRTMLTWHQGIGLGLLGLQLSTTVVGQLNYSDKYADGPQTDRYRSTHKALAYTTLAVFATAGLVALLAPSPKTPKKLDRVMIHRIAMGVATAGMATQVGLGLYTRERVGYQDQERLATAHLAVGYVTLAAMLVGVGALIL
jgi:hypothetical protein